MEDENEGFVLLNKKYKLIEKIGSGSFGSIYMCNFYIYFR